METRKKTILQIIIFSIVFLIAVNIWPIANIQKHTKSETASEQVTTQLQTKDDRILAHIFFEQSHIENITTKVNVYQCSDVDSVTFQVLDSQFKAIYSKLIRVEQIERDGEITVNVDLDVEPGADYFYEFVVPQTNEYGGDEPVILSLPLANMYDSGQSEPKQFFINGDYQNTLCFISTFDYTQDFSLKERCVAFIGLAVIATALYLLITKIIEKTKLYQKEEKIQRALKILVMAVTFIGAAVALVLSSFVNIWGGNTDDRVVFAVGIITLATWIYLALYGKKEAPVNKNTNPVIIWRNYIQTVALAMAIYSACRFVNAESEITHVINTRRIVTYLLVAFAMIPDKKNRPDFKIWKNWNIPGVIIWGAFLILMMVNNQGFTWPPVILLFLIPLAFRMTKAGQVRLLNNFSWAVYLSFAITTGYSLLHRPYNKWIFYRYSGMFHTVAYTGMYLSMVVAVAFARYIAKKRRFDLFMFATSFGYVLLSMTRTAMLAIMGAVVVALILIIATKKDDFKTIGKQALILIGVVLTAFCMTFSATRMIPALVNDPIYMNVEGTDAYGVSKGEKIDSPRYMRFNRYLAIMFGRFGVEEKTTEASQTNENETSESVTTATENTNSEETQTETVEVSAANLNGNISNGRLDIFKAFIANITWEPHDTFACTYEDEEYGHAHNAWLQIAYLFGLLTGIVFGIYCIYTFIISIIYFTKHKNNKNALVPMMIVGIFGITSIIEWTYQPGIPIGFCFMYVAMFLLKREVEDKPKK